MEDFDLQQYKNCFPIELRSREYFKNSRTNIKIPLLFLKNIFQNPNKFWLNFVFC